MSDYDDTNKGAVYTPFADQKLLMSGKLDVDGDKKGVFLINGTDREGNDIFIVTQRIGSMYFNENATDDNNQPNYSGPMDGNMRLAGWTKTFVKDGETVKYLALNRSEKRSSQDNNNQSQQASNSNIPAPIDQKAMTDDRIPF